MFSIILYKNPREYHEGFYFTTGIRAPLMPFGAFLVLTFRAILFRYIVNWGMRLRMHTWKGESLWRPPFLYTIWWHNKTKTPNSRLGCLLLLCFVFEGAISYYPTLIGCIESYSVNCILFLICIGVIWFCCNSLTENAVNSVKGILYAWNRLIIIRLIRSVGWFTSI